MGGAAHNDVQRHKQKRERQIAIGAKISPRGIGDGQKGVPEILGRIARIHLAGLAASRQPAFVNKFLLLVVSLKKRISTLQVWFPESFFADCVMPRTGICVQAVAVCGILGR